MQTGISAARRSGCPIPTRTIELRLLLRVTTSESTPRPVSIVIGPSGAWPRATTKCATQRTPLPHISASLPSALNMRMRAAATFEGSTSTRPSPPIPRCRSEICVASICGSAGIRWDSFRKAVDVNVIVSGSMHLHKECWLVVCHAVFVVWSALLSVGFRAAILFVELRFVDSLGCVSATAVSGWRPRAWGRPHCSSLDWKSYHPHE